MLRALVQLFPRGFWLIVVLPFSLFAQNLPTQGSISRVKGQVSIQKKGSSSWAELAKGTPIETGDAVKTEGKSYAVITFGKQGRVTVGAKSQVSFEATQLEEDGAPVPYVTIAQGGAVVDWRQQNGIVTATNVGVGFSPSGSFSVMISKDDKTIFNAFNGNLAVQDLENQQESNLSSGQYTEIARGQPPTPGEKLSPNVLSLHKRFFPSAVYKKWVSSGKSAKGEDKEPKPSTDEEIEKFEKENEEPVKVSTFFDLQKIISRIREIEKLDLTDYRPPYWVDPMLQHSVYLETKFNFSLVSGADPTSYPGVKARFGYNMGSLSMGFNYPVETQHRGGFKVMSFDGLPGILDKIYYLDYNSTSLKLHFGEIRDFTVHRGGFISGFSNELRSQIEQPLGVMALWQPNYFWKFTAFSPDLATYDIVGATMTYDNGYTATGFAYMADLNQGEGLYYGDSAYRAGAIPSFDSASNTGALHSGEVYFESNFMQHELVNGFVYVSLALYYSPEDKEIIGYSGQAPGIQVIWKRLSGYAEGRAAIDRGHVGYFNDFYLEDRTRVYSTDNNFSKRALSQVERHPPMGTSRGFLIGGDWQILDHLWTGIAYGQNIGTTNQDEIKEDSTFVPEDKKLRELNIDRNMKFHIFAGNDLFKGLRRAKLYYDMKGGAFGRTIADDPISETRKYPLLRNVLSDSFFSSLNTEYGFLMEYSFLKNTSIVAQFRGYSLDLNGNGIADSDESVMEFSTSWRMIF